MVQVRHTNSSKRKRKIEKLGEPWLVEVTEKKSGNWMENAVFFPVEGNI